MCVCALSFDKNLSPRYSTAQLQCVQLNDEVTRFCQKTVNWKSKILKFEKYVCIWIARWSQNSVFWDNFDATGSNWVGLFWKKDGKYLSLHLFAVKWDGYDSFHWKYCTSEVHRIERLSFLGISRYKFKLRFWFNSNLMALTVSTGNTAYCIWSVISSISSLNRWSSSLGLFCHVPLRELGLFCHVPLERDQQDWDWRLGWDDTPNAIRCTTPPRSTESRESASSVSRGKNSNWDFDLFWIYTEEHEFSIWLISGV